MANPNVAGYNWVNATDAVERPRRFGWEKDNKGVWDYKWGAGVSDVTKDNNDPLVGQNNPKPLGIFSSHFLVKLTINGADVFFDPSYGKKFNSVLAWENASVAFYAFGIAPLNWKNVRYTLGYQLGKNPTGANDPVDVERDMQITDH